jgi:RNA polymerase sigma-70 factor (ECF subfamily)
MAPKIDPIDPADHELLRRIRSGDRVAFATVYQRCQGPVYRFVLHMSGSRTLAEDVTQETFMSIIAEQCSFDDSRGTLEGYLMGVARNKVLRRMEKDGAYVPFPTESDDRSGATVALGNGHMRFLTVMPADLVREEMIDRVRDAVMSLPASYREVVVLCDLQEMKYEEAAGVLDCAVGTVRSRLHRARALLMEKLRAAAPSQERLATGEAARSRGIA